MWFELGEYMKATPLLNELRILTWLKMKPNTSQAKLAKAVGLAPAMVNTYIRRFSETGLLNSVHCGPKRMEYEITPDGDRTRTYHLITFLSQVCSLFDEVLGDLKNRIDTTCLGEKPRVVIYGAGETGRMVYLAIQSLSRLSVVGVVDDDPEKVDQDFFSLKVQNFEVLDELRPDAILVASWRYSDAMVSRIAGVATEKGIEVVRLIP